MVSVVIKYLPQLTATTFLLFCKLMDCWSWMMWLIDSEGGGVDEEELDRREGKSPRCCLGTYLNAALAIWQQGWFEEMFFEEHPFWKGEALVWREPDDHPFSWSIHFAKCSSIHPFLQIILVLNQFVPQPAATIFDFPSVCLLFYDGRVSHKIFSLSIF